MFNKNMKPVIYSELCENCKQDYPCEDCSHLIDETAHTCKYCGSADAEYIVNPYEDDVHGEIVMEWICEDCSTKLASDL